MDTISVVYHPSMDSVQTCELEVPKDRTGSLLNTCESHTTSAVQGFATDCLKVPFRNNEQR